MTLYARAQKISGFLRFLFHLRDEGSENMPLQGKLILCSNHRSNYDPVLLGAVLPRPLFFMGKEVLFKIPLFNKLIVTLGAFPVKRGAGDREAIRKAIEIVDRGDVLAMFPEGHRLKKGGELQRFQSGTVRIAAKTGAAILPVAIICKGRVHLWRKKLVRVGRPMTLEELGYQSGGTENLHEVSEKLRQIVSALLEERP